MEDRSRRRPRRRRWTPAILLAVVALTVLVVASPAVARPAHMAHAHGATLSAPGTIAIVVIALCAALALVLAAFFSGQERSPRVETSRPKPVSRSCRPRPDCVNRPRHDRVRLVTKGAVMLEHIPLGPRKGPIALSVLVALTAAILFGVCAPAPALRPRTTPAHAAALAAASAAHDATRGATTVARHDAMISRVAARHDAAGVLAGPRIHRAFAGHDRLHRPAALTATGALAAATFAALAAIVLVGLAAVAGTRREEARRRRAAAPTPARLQAQRGRLAG